MAQSFCLYVKVLIFAPLLRKARAFSSAGSEHLPYKQRVGGSNPSTPTKKEVRSREPLFLWAWRPPFFSSLMRTVALRALRARGLARPNTFYLRSFFEALRTNKMTNIFFRWRRFCRTGVRGWILLWFYRLYHVVFSYRGLMDSWAYPHTSE